MSKRATILSFFATGVVACSFPAFVLAAPGSTQPPLTHFSACASASSAHTCMTGSKRVGVFSGAGPYSLLDYRIITTPASASTPRSVKRQTYRVPTRVLVAASNGQGLAAWLWVPTLNEGTRPLTTVSDTLVIVDGNGHGAFTRAGGHRHLASYTTVSKHSAPTVIITSAPSTSANTSATVEFTVSGLISKTACTLDGVHEPCASGSAHLNGLSVAAHVFVVVVSGPGGTDSASATFKVIAAAPTVTITGAPAASSSNTSATVFFTVSGSVSATACTLDGAGTPCGSGSASFTGLSVGAHTFVVAVSGPGGADSASAAFNVTVPAAPTVTITSAPATSANTSADVSFSSAGVVGAVACTLDDVVTVCASGSAHLTNLTVGSHTFVVAVSGPGGSNTASVTFSVTAPAPASAGPVGDPGNWNVILDDEFTGTTLNTNLWSTGWFGSGITGPINVSDELECYDPAQVVVGGGELDLNLIAKSETCPTGSGPVTEPYTSGIITTAGKFTYTYGFLEARVWLPGAGALTDWPAVWATGTNWPQNGELDVLEGLGGSACYHFHYGTPSDPQAQGGCAAGSYSGGWHTFGADWEPGVVTWYYDGVAVGTMTSDVTASPLEVILNLAVDNTYGGPIQTPATMRVDYVRVWQHPPATS